MPKFKRGDIVRVRINIDSPHKGQIGTIDFEPINDSVRYIVKFESGEYSRHISFVSQDLELVADQKDLAKPSSDVLRQ
jgi:hypothetical protein